MSAASVYIKTGFVVISKCKPMKQMQPMEPKVDELAPAIEEQDTLGELKELADHHSANTTVALPQSGAQCEKN